MRKKHFVVSQIILMTGLGLLAIICMYPLWHCIIGSIMPFDEYINKNLLIWAEAPTFEAYKYIIEQGTVFKPMLVTIFITIFGTVFNLFLTTVMGYGLSKKIPGRSFIMIMIVLTMFISIGLIPNYMLYRTLNLLNTPLVHIFPVAINTFYLIIMRTHFISFPTEIEDVAKIDGCNEFSTFFKIVVPLSKPIIITILLFTAVDYWNTFSSSVYYVTDPNKITLQDFMYRILSGISMNAAGSGMNVITGDSGVKIFADTIKLAYTVVTVLPIILVYPFVQKYISSGIMVGSLKG